jgi:hypothetical protein
VQTRFHGSRLNAQNGGYLLERQFLVLEENQGFALLRRECGNGVLDYLRLLLLQKLLGQFRCFADLRVFEVDIPLAQPVVSAGVISDGSVEISAEGAFGRIEMAGGTEERQKALLCDVFGSGGGVRQAICHSENHLPVSLEQQHEGGLASARLVEQGFVCLFGHTAHYPIAG